MSGDKTDMVFEIITVQGGCLANNWGRQDGVVNIINVICIEISCQRRSF